MQGTWLVCSNLTTTVNLSMVTLNFSTGVFFDNLQCAGLVCSTLTGNGGPAKIYPLIYHQVLRADNLQCAGHVAVLLYPDGTSWTY